MALLRMAPECLMFYWFSLDFSFFLVVFQDKLYH